MHINYYYMYNMYLYSLIMNIKMVMKLAAGHSVSNMFSSYIPPPFSRTGVFYFTCRQGNDGKIQPVCELN